MTTYVVGTDGSESAGKAAERAGELAQATGASVLVVCAYARGGRTTVGVGSDVYSLTAFGDAEQIAEQQASAYRLAGITATIAVSDAKPAAAILEEAERVAAELIVVGNRRVQGVQRVLGAVANDVVRHAPCDVLIVKTV